MKIKKFNERILETTKKFICPICGAIASLRIKGSISREVTHEGSIIIDYEFPANDNFNLFCSKHKHIMIGGSADDFEFVKSMFDAGVYVDTFSVGGAYNISIDTSNNEHKSSFNSLLITLNPSIAYGISYDLLDSIIERICCSNEKYLDVIECRYDEQNIIQDNFEDCEKFDTRSITVSAVCDNAQLSEGEREAFHDKNRSIFISFCKELAKRVKEEMEYIKGETNNA